MVKFNLAIHKLSSHFKFENQTPSQCRCLLKKIPLVRNMQFNAKLLKRNIDVKDLVPCGAGAQPKNNHYGIETIET